MSAARTENERTLPGSQHEAAGELARASGGAGSRCAALPRASKVISFPRTRSRRGSDTNYSLCFYHPERARVRFDVPPEKMQLRLLVWSRAGAEVGLETRDITIPDSGRRPRRPPTPVILRARTPREMQQLKADPGGRWSSRREFAPADRRDSAAAHGPAIRLCAFSARLLSRTGQAMSQLTVSPPDAAGLLPQPELPLAEWRRATTSSKSTQPGPRKAGSSWSRSA